VFVQCQLATLKTCDYICSGSDFEMTSTIVN